MSCPYFSTKALLNIVNLVVKIENPENDIQFRGNARRAIART